MQVEKCCSCLAGLLGGCSWRVPHETCLPSVRLWNSVLQGLAANSVGDAGTGGVWEGYQGVPVFGSALGGAEVFTACVFHLLFQLTALWQSLQGGL